MLKYLERTWIGKKVEARGNKPASRRAPIFALDTWNVFIAIQEKDPIVTNNTLESFNRTWNQEMGVNSNIWRIINGFKNKESEVKHTLVSNAAGRDLNTNSGRNSLVQGHYERIAGITGKYSTIPSDLYINLIAHELSLH